MIEAKDPLQHWDPRADRNGFGLTFAKLYKDSFLSTGKNTLIIPCGKGNTGFMDNQWNKGDVLYNDALIRIKWVLDNYPNSTLKVILWQQGERDLQYNNTDYRANLDIFVNNILMDLGENNNNFVFIAGGMVPFWTNLNPKRINSEKIIETLPSRIEHTGFADPNNPFIIIKPDNNIDTVHFDAAGQREMGRRYFETYRKIK
ncbi:MAG: sialate O-acetylesterase [Bacteroidia bacterium]|nr:sialate O-acetylesterase [Bacteroidia bacterium]